MAIIRQSETQFGIPRTIVDDNVKDGYYAVQLHADGDYTYMRVSRPETGEYRGCIKFQTVHGDTLKVACILRPDGVYEVRNGDIKQVVIQIASKPQKAAFEYGRRIGHCCRCGKKLTRHPWTEYGIGIECDTQWPEIRQLAEQMLENNEV